jgi:hypothetical protein
MFFSLNCNRVTKIIMFFLGKEKIMSINYQSDERLLQRSIPAAMAIRAPSVSTSTISFDGITNSFKDMLINVHAQYESDLAQMAGTTDLSLPQLLIMQANIQKFNSTYELNSSLNKSLGDLLKSLVRNMG